MRSILEYLRSRGGSLLMKDSPPSSSMRNICCVPIDMVRERLESCAALGSNLDALDGLGGRTSNGLGSSVWYGNPMVPMVPPDMVRPRTDLGSNREARLGEGGLTVKGLGSSSSSLRIILEPMLAVDWVRL